MQHRMSNKFTLTRVVILFATCASVVVADNLSGSQYSMLLAVGQSNPWALPQSIDNQQGIHRATPDANKQYSDNQTNIQYPGYRFVTPEILESLKQQQMQTQQMPDSYSQQSSRKPQQKPPEQNQWQSGHLYSDYPLMGGSGMSNPLYDEQVTSPWNNPWNNTQGGLYQGKTFPWLPDAAIGGIPPIPVQPLIENNANGKESGKQYFENNAFNPFTFGPNGNL